MPQAGEMVRVRARISGRVQGVFYRASTVERAQALGLVGWVRNAADGSVELEAQGGRREIEALLTWCRTGPAAADVAAVEHLEIAVDVGPTGTSASTDSGMTDRERRANSEAEVDWGYRLAAYAYCRDIVSGKTVLEIGCDAGQSAAFLAALGAAEVVGVDPDPRSIERARSRYRLSNLEFRCDDAASLEMKTDSQDCVVVPDVVEHLYRLPVLRELRRVLRPGGTLVACGPSSDRVGSARGASFYHFVERLQPLFAPVFMHAQQPFVGMSLVAFGDDDAPLDVEVDVSVRQHHSPAPDVTHYLALCGDRSVVRSTLAIMELPSPGASAPSTVAAVDQTVAVESASPTIDERGQGRSQSPWDDESACAATALDDAVVQDELADLRERLSSARNRLAERDEELGCIAVSEDREQHEGPLGRRLRAQTGRDRDSGSRPGRRDESARSWAAAAAAGNRGRRQRRAPFGNEHG